MVTVQARAEEWSVGVGAWGIRVTVVDTLFAFIDVWSSNKTLLILSSTKHGHSIDVSDACIFIIFSDRAECTWDADDQLFNSTLTYTRDSVSRVARVARAVERAVIVGTIGVCVAVVMVVGV